ncbi:MAG: gamma-glutamyl-phosphate reductase, partial [Pseudomonadota bacterium]
MLATERADDQTDVSRLMAEMGRAARAAARTLAQATSAQKAEALAGAAQGIRGGVKDILEANAKDLEAAKARGISPAFIDRLALDEARINGIASGLDEVAKAKDPVG